MARGSLFMTGSIASSGNMPTHMTGIAFSSADIPLRIGSTKSSTFRTLAMPQIIGFKCDGISLFTPTPLGTSETKDMSLSFPGGTGVNRGIDLNIGNISTDGSMDLSMGLPAPASGTMNIAVSGAHGIVNTIPCVEGNLIQKGAYLDNENMTLHINRNVSSGILPLRMSSPDPSTSTMPFNLNTAPFGSGLNLDQTGHALSNSNTTLVLNDRNKSNTMSLFSASPEPVTGTASLMASGDFNPAANSLDNNYCHQVSASPSTSQFDESSSAENLITSTGSNSISRNKLSSSNTNDYGVRRVSKVGGSIENFDGNYVKNFYDKEVSRDSIDSNGTYLAVGSNTSTISSQNTLQIFDVISSESIKLKYEYKNFLEDLKSLSVFGDDEPYLKMYYKSVKVSDKHKIAVSLRVRSTLGDSDLVCILEPATITQTSTQAEVGDECAIEPITSEKIFTTSIDGWKITKAISSRYWNSTDSEMELNSMIGSSVAWKNEDLYYDKQSGSYASIYAAYESESYATRKAFGFSDTSDGFGYYSNRNNLPNPTKVAFGSSIKIYGDLAFVSAPLLDSYVANNTLSALNAASPDGAVYVFKYDSSWSHVDTVYSGGYTSADIAGKDSCGYEPKLFGYSFDYDTDSEILAVGEPMSKKVYQFTINSSGEAVNLSEYSSSLDGFGAFVGSISNTIITNSKSSIEDPRYSSSVSYSSSNIQSEVSQYTSGEAITDTSETIHFVKKVSLKGKDVLLAGRDFSVTYGFGKITKIQKISLLNLTDLNGTLMIQGPLPSTSDLNLSFTRPSGNATGDMGITFAAYGVNSNTTLFTKAPIGATGDISLHLRAETSLKFPLSLQASYVSGTSFMNTYVAAPSGASSITPMVGLGHGNPTLATDMFLRGTAGNEQVLGFDLFIKQVDIYNASGTQNFQMLDVLGPGTGNATALNTLYLGAGDFGPASGISTAVMKGPDNITSTGTLPIRLQVDPPSGVANNTGTLMLENTQDRIPSGSLVGGIITRKGINITMNAAGSSTGTSDLTLFRRGTDNFFEHESTMGLSLTNVTVATGLNVYISGAPTITNTMNVAISGVFGSVNNNRDLHIGGYES